MKTLNIVVSGKSIEFASDCDLSGLVPGADEQVRVKFTFSKGWNNYTKVVGFWSIMGREYPPRPLEDGESCIIPREALAKQSFKLQVLGKRNGTRRSTDKLIIHQKGGLV